MRVLFLAPTLPWPLDAGGRIRSFQLLRELGREHELHLWCVRQPAAAAEAESALREVCQELRVFERNPARGLGSVCAPRAEAWFHSRGLRQALSRLSALDGIDLIHLDELCLLRALPETPPCAVLAHHHKLDLELARALEPAGARAELELGRWRLLEREAVALTREHVFCCEQDAQRFALRHPRVRARVVESGFDPEYFRPLERQRERDQLLLLGSLDYEPNARGLESFLETTWPRVVRARPALRLSIVGRGAQLERWRGLPAGVRLVGGVDDVRPWLARATALVVPLEIGGGTRLKLVEAAACGCPLITTRVGAEGLDLLEGEHLWLADGLPELGACIERALASPESLARRAQAARRRVLERYTWPQLARRLGLVWESAAAPVRS